MTGLLLVVAALATTTSVRDLPDYAEAYNLHKEEGKPLVVLIGAEWCPACRSMKSSYIPDALAQGTFKDVVFTIVDVDAEQKLAKRLMRGSSVPQLVMFYNSENGPKRVQLSGVQDVDSISNFVARGVEARQERHHVGRVPATLNLSTGGS